MAGGKRGRSKASKGVQGSKKRAGTAIVPTEGAEGAPLPVRVRRGKVEVRGEDAGLHTRWLDPAHAQAVKRRGRVPAKTVERARALFLEALEVLGEVATRKASRKVQDSEGNLAEIGPTFAESTAAAAELRRAGYGDRLHLTGEGGGDGIPQAFTVVVMTGQPQPVPQPTAFLEIATAASHKETPP